MMMMMMDMMLLMIIIIITSYSTDITNCQYCYLGSLP